MVPNNLMVHCKFFLNFFRFPLVLLLFLLFLDQEHLHQIDID